MENLFLKLADTYLLTFLSEHLTTISEVNSPFDLLLLTFAVGNNSVSRNIKGLLLWVKQKFISLARPGQAR